MPPRMEVNLEDCEVEGTIPSEIDGAFVRVGAEWYYPPKYADDAILNADGYISSFRISNGKVDYKGRWVETHRLKEQRKARKQIYGYYRNPYTDDKDIQDPEHPNLRTVSNTAPLTHAGKLFTLKEDGLPHEIDPNTLQTIGPWDFHGKWKSETFSAHPKLDPLTGEMVSFGYEATGLCSDDLWIYTVGPNGQVSNEVRTKVPYVSVIHDMALTHRHVVIPFGGYVTSKQRLLDGKIHWGWDQNQPSYIGVMPRDGDPKDMRWFKGPERCMMHTFNAHSEGNKVILYAPFYDGNFFPFFPPIDGSPWDPRKARSFIRKITLDLDSKKDTYEEEILWPNPIMDLGKVDPRVLSLQTRYLFAPFNDESKPFDRSKAPNGPARVTNSYGRFDITTGKMESVFAGATHSLAEQTFIPTGTSGREGEGYLIGVASNFAERRSELIIADAERLHEGVIARVLLPFTAASQVHGEWSNARALGLS
ncbi:MAG: carotenoid oxygenase family protein [Gammaproteobacteria bacterium]|nr:carotenoid oxygenase family protein [Gammaproteobacteria bacterium]